MTTAVNPPVVAHPARTRAFAVIWAAQLIARIGNGLTAFGLGVYVYQTTASSAGVAAVILAAFVPGIALAPFAGVLADRFDRRLLMILGDAFSAVGLVALLVMIHTGFGTVPVVCLCVAVSSVFGSVMDPAYRALVTDLLPATQYARAAGAVQFASAAQYLISPAIAGILMAVSGIELVVMIDIVTMVVTTVAMVSVWRTVPVGRREHHHGLWDQLAGGWSFLRRNHGITILMSLVTLVTFCMGFLQTLLTPMMLDITTEQVLGAVRSAAAVGMLIASVVIGVRSMGSRHLRAMSLALVAAGVSVFFLGVTENVMLIGVLAFLFFAMLPVLNTSVEVLARAAIPNEVQGRVWGLMGLISQLGYVVAYAVSGVLADAVFSPLLVPGGALADSLGRIIGTGPSRGIGLMFMLVGLLLITVAVILPRVRAVGDLEVCLQRQTMELKGTTH